MNRKQFGILLILLVILGGAGLLLRKNHERAANEGEQGTGQKLLGDNFPINDVTELDIKHGTNELVLFKKDDMWRVRERSDYPANFSQISDFLIKAADLKVIQNEEVGPSQLARLELEPGTGTNSGVIVDLKNKDGKSIKTLALGKKHINKSARPPSQFSMGGDNMSDGRYVFVGGNTHNALLIADPLNNLEAKPDVWVSKDFFKIERPKAIAVTFPAATNSWKIVRDTETGDWNFSDAKGDEKLDQARASGVSSPFSSPSFTDVLPANTQPQPAGLDKPTVVTVDTFDDLTYTVKVGSKTNDDYPITVTVAANFPKQRVPAKDEKPEDKAKADTAWAKRQSDLEARVKQTKEFENWIYLIPSWTVEPVLKDRKDLVAEKKEETKKEDSTDSQPVIEKHEEGLVPPEKPDAK
ncbi:MAG TPA: DUF4340 domain-containing protein [Verrucomicrobiae bacterium]|jgi:hypothetical protein|nr:DUF4340 domain-containing protein [Verrucomicrobiae bacterium]